MASAPVPARTREFASVPPSGIWDLHRPCGYLVVYTCLRQNPGFASVPDGTWRRGVELGEMHIFDGTAEGPS